MRIQLLVFLLLPGFAAFCQPGVAEEKKAVLSRVQQFFTAMEKQDTAMFQDAVAANGQSWAVRKRNDSSFISFRSFGDRVYKFENPAQVIQEKILSAEVKIHQQIAMAWVPYTLSISGKFSHCGVDVFTLLKSDHGWKIVNISYTVEPNGCKELE
ncbi:MAG: hypothetical protein RLZZ28_1507 [Bacteroidota bacterium]